MKYKRETLQVGTKIRFKNNDEYEILKVLGQGATGIVYKAKAHDNSVYAIKEFFPLNSSFYRAEDFAISIINGETVSMEAIKKIIREEHEFSNLLGGENASIVQTRYEECAYFNGSSKEIHNNYLIMMNLQGMTLDDYITSCTTRNRPGLKDFTEIIKKFLYEIGRVHRLGYVLTDIKAENLYMYGNDVKKEQWHPFIIDYGNVIKLDNSFYEKYGYQATEPITGEVLGTKGYASYEMVYGDRVEDDEQLFRLTPATDIYSVGRLFLYLITGKTYTRELNGNSVVDTFVDSLEDKNDEFLDSTIKKLKEQRKRIGCSEYAYEIVEKILRNTLSNDRKKRYQTAEEFIQDLEVLQNRLDVKFYLTSSMMEQNIDTHYIERTEYYEALDNAFSKNNIVVLRGQKGVGKTELANRYAKIHKDKDDNNVVVYKTYQDVKNIIIGKDESRVSAVLKEIPVYDEAKCVNKNDAVISYLESYSNRFRVLQSLCDKNVLLVIDNFDVFDEISIKELSNLNCKILITSIIDYSSLHVSQICVENMDLEEGVKLYRSYCPFVSEKDIAIVENIVNHVAGLTQAIIIIASKQYVNRYPTEKIYNDLTTMELYNAENRIEYYKDGKLHEDSDMHIMDSLFDLSEFSLKQQDILFILSMMGNAGVSVESLKLWSNLSDYFDINKLLGLNWIKLNQYDDLYIVAVIRSVVLRRKYNVSVLCEFVNAYCDSESEKNIKIYKEIIISLIYYADKFLIEKLQLDKKEIIELIVSLNRFIDECKPIINLQVKKLLLALSEKVSILIMEYFGNSDDLKTYKYVISSIISNRINGESVEFENEFVNYIKQQDGLCDYYVYDYYKSLKDNIENEIGDMGFGKTLYYLRYASYYGDSIELHKDEDKEVIEELIKEAEKEDSCSKCILGEYYLNASENYYDDRGYDYLKDLIVLRDKIALRLLGDVYLFYFKDSNTAKELYTLSAKNSDTESMIRLGHISEQNNNMEEAFEFYKKAASEGSLMGKNNVAFCLINSVTEREQAFNYLKEIAQYGHPLGMSNLGMVYVSFEDIKDIKKALKWQNMAAETGSVLALERLSIIYEEGLLGELDYKKAFQYRVKALEANGFENLEYIAEAYMNGQGVEKNEKLALYYYNKGVEYGQLGCYRGLISFHMKNNPSKAFQLLEEMTPIGEGVDFYFLAQAFQYGLGTEIDSSKAFYWYNEALNHGEDRAYLDLGEMYEYGDGVEVNYQKAYEYYQKSAEHKDEKGMYNLGRFYASGHIMEPDYPMAVYWYKKSSELGCEEAKEELGRAYLYGQGTDINVGRALEMFEQCKDIKDAELLYRIGYIYEFDARNKNMEKALEWYEKAAEHKNIDAMMQVAYMYANASNVMQNKQYASMWVDRAEKEYIERHEYNLKNKMKIKMIRYTLSRI